MTLFFVTCNSNKLLEARMMIPGLEHLALDLPEIQELDLKRVVEAKLIEARKHTQEDIVVEDVSLSLNCLNGLPGPLIKWFLKAIGMQGIFRIAESLNDLNCVATCVVGYCRGKDNSYFEGFVKGKIVHPRGSSNFGWDPIFVPAGHLKTFAEMSLKEKNMISHRSIAFGKLATHIVNNNNQ
ncbi:MAG: non-canonical purine NTP pyrophosphatase [Candidatus Woesearchaeota archaeon]